MELQAEREKFEAQGIELVVVTYDSEADQQKFVNRYKIDFPMVSDIETSTVSALGIVNKEIAEDSGAYGVPYPGFFVLDRTGTIKSRSFLEGYEKRVSSGSLLASAIEALAD